MIVEIIAAVLGLIQGVLVMLNRRSNWVFYILQMVFLLVFSLINRLYGDVVNNSIYLVLGVAGLLSWDRSGSEKGGISSAGLRERIAYTLLTAAGTAAVGYILGMTDDPLPVLDAFTTVTSFIATYYMVRRKLDAWIIWFVNDIFYAVEYFILPDQALYLFALNVIWTGMAAASYVNWRKIMISGEETI